MEDEETGENFETSARWKSCKFQSWKSPQEWGLWSSAASVSADKGAPPVFQPNSSRVVTQIWQRGSGQSHLCEPQTRTVVMQAVSWIKISFSIYHTYNSRCSKHLLNASKYVKQTPYTICKENRGPRSFPSVKSCLGEEVPIYETLFSLTISKGGKLIKEESSSNISSGFWTLNLLSVYSSYSNYWQPTMVSSCLIDARDRTLNHTKPYGIWAAVTYQTSGL